MNDARKVPPKQKVTVDKSLPNGVALFGKNLFGEARLPPSRGVLGDKFIIPPFSVLDGRSGFWRTRRAAWDRVGFQSELGRADNLLSWSQACRRDFGARTGVFCPVLCELAYRWFCPPGGAVLDPFAGGVCSWAGGGHAWS